jgi:hypothetical protein
MSSDSFKGGDKLISVLQQYQKNLGNDPTVSVGFFSGSTESKTGIPSAQVALLNEYGSNRSGTKKDGTTYNVYTPPRPFFRNMIRKGKLHWGIDLGKYLKKYDFDSNKALNSIGGQMSEELQESIQAPGYTPLAQSTIDRKGNSQTLIETNDMMNAVSHQVDT